MKVDSTPALRRRRPTAPTQSSPKRSRHHVDETRSSSFRSACCTHRHDNDACPGERADQSAEWPDIREAKAIAEEGFIYGLPIVMNYAVMYEYAVDRNSGQFKAPFNQIKNEARVYTYKDTAVITPNSDTPYSFVMAGSARRADGSFRAGCGEESLLFGAAYATATRSIMDISVAARPAARPGDYMVVGPDWQGATPPGIKKVFQSTTQFSVAAYRTQLFDPADMPNVEKVQAGYKVQPLSAYLKQPVTVAAAADRLSQGRCRSW